MSLEGGNWGNWGRAFEAGPQNAVCSGWEHVLLSGVCMVRAGDLRGVCGCLQTGSYGNPLHGQILAIPIGLLRGHSLRITQVGVGLVRFGSDSQAEDPFSFLASHNRRH